MSYILAWCQLLHMNFYSLNCGLQLTKRLITLVFDYWMNKLRAAVQLVSALNINESEPKPKPSLRRLTLTFASFKVHGTLLP